MFHSSISPSQSLSSPSQVSSGAVSIISSQAHVSALYVCEIRFPVAPSHTGVGLQLAGSTAPHTQGTQAAATIGSAQSGLQIEQTHGSLHVVAQVSAIVSLFKIPSAL